MYDQQTVSREPCLVCLRRLTLMGCFETTPKWKVNKECLSITSDVITNDTLRLQYVSTR